MQYDDNAEKYGYEGEMTPLKCDELQAYKGDVYIPVYGSIADADVYLKKDADTAIAELKDVIHELQTENTELKKKLMPCLNGDCILTCEVVEKYGKENAELKAKLEDVQASAYADSVDAGMENRRLKRALWIARAKRAEARKNYWYARSCHEGDKYLWSIDGSAVKYIGCIKRTNYDWLLTWSEVESKCRAKAEEYK